MTEKIAILGAGSWGLAIADLLHNNGHQVTIWEFDQTACMLLKQDRTLPDKLADFTLNRDIKVTCQINECLHGSTMLVLAIPAQFLRSTLKQIKLFDKSIGVINLAKGIETGTLQRMSEVIADELELGGNSIATLSGPSHAEEVIKGLPTAVVVGSKSNELGIRVQETFSNESFRVYISDDIIGVELGGSLKNIVAIAAGIIEGLNMGDNTIGALLTRGLAEIARLGAALGARPETFAGLSGIGDLITTCVSKHSRNRHVGEAIGRGETLEQILERMTMVAEGVQTTRSGRDLARRHAVEMPITEQVYQVLFGKKPAAEAVAELMGRTLKTEIWN